MPNWCVSRKTGIAFALRLIVRRNNQRLYRAARAIVRDDSEAEDVLQEAYLSAFGNLTKFRADASLATWLARIVMNKAIRHLRPKSIMVPSDPAENVKWLDAEVIATFPFQDPRGAEFTDALLGSPAETKPTGQSSQRSRRCPGENNKGVLTVSDHLDPFSTSNGCAQLDPASRPDQVRASRALKGAIDEACHMRARGAPPDWGHEVRGRGH